MDYTLILLRLLHIVAAFAWVGVGIAMTFVILPSALASSENGMRYLRTSLQHSPLGRIIPISGGLTVLAGILLYALSDAQAHFSDAGNRVLGLGALVGFLAAIHSGAFTGRALRRLQAALTEKTPDDSRPMLPDDLRLLREHTTQVIGRARVSTLLTIVALLGMGSARYL